MSVALITGTSTGIGLATAVTLARAGHTVYAAMRNLDEGGGELRELAEAEKLPATAVKIDVDDDASVSGCIARVLAEAGRIDVLVNNAGIGGGGAVEEVKLDDVRQIMETNFFGPLRCIQAVLPGMRKQQGGVHRQHLLHCRAHRGRAPGALRGLQVGAGGAQRSSGPRGEALQRPRGADRAGNHCNAHLQQG